jgi:hypothetical protein
MRSMHRYTLFALALLTTQLYASEQVYVRDARLSWAAFECSALAQEAGSKDDERRLRSLGLKRGRVFLKHAQEAKLSRRQLEDLVPSGMVPSLRMESTDLIIGSYSRAAADFAVERARSDEKELGQSFTQATMAFSHYVYRNCHLIQ